MERSNIFIQGRILIKCLYGIRICLQMTVRGDCCMSPIENLIPMDIHDYNKKTLSYSLSSCTTARRYTLDLRHQFSAKLKPHRNEESGGHDGCEPTEDDEADV